MRAKMFSPFFKGLSSAKKIAFLAVFLALSVVTNTFLDIDFGSTNKLTFTYLACFYAAYLLGALPAFVVGFVGDGIGFLIKPSGVYWLFGLTLGIYAFLAGIVVRYLPARGRAAPYIKAAVALAVCYVAITLCLNSVVNYYYVKVILYHGDYNKAFWVYLGGRIGIQTAVYAVNAAVVFVLLPVISQVPVRFGGKSARAAKDPPEQNKL